jgi:DNA repair protein RadD
LAGRPVSKSTEHKQDLSDRESQSQSKQDSSPAAPRPPDSGRKQEPQPYADLLDIDRPIEVPRTIELRDYQHKVIADFDRALAAGHRRILLVAPTGSGKTVIGAEIIRRARAQDRSVLVLAHRREIIAQTHGKLVANGVRAGIIQAGIDPRPMERVQVASIGTLWSRAFRSECMQRPLAHLLVIDECHHALARTYQKIIEEYPDAILLGLTATPCRGDGRGLGGIFETIIECPQVAKLIDLDHLVASRVYAPIDPDLRGVGTRNGDFIEGDLAARMDRPLLVGDIVTHWHKYGERRRTVVFAINVAHSMHLRDEFCRSGVRAEHIDGGTPKDERDAILARLESGETEVISNCAVLTEGWNMPEVSVCVLARPTKKMGLFRQMIGRVLRPAPGKNNAIVLDHSGAVYRHGLPEDHVDWTLDPDKGVATSPAHVARNKNGSRLVECSQCSALRVGGLPCPSCGFMPARPAQYVPIADGELTRVTNNAKPGASSYDPAERARWHGMLTRIGTARGYKMPGWASVQYKEKFGAWPPYGQAPEPLEPTAEVLSWVRSRQIAYAKRRVANGP